MGTQRMDVIGGVGTQRMAVIGGVGRENGCDWSSG